MRVLDVVGREAYIALSIEERFGIVGELVCAVRLGRRLREDSLEGRHDDFEMPAVAATVWGIVRSSG